MKKIIVIGIFLCLGSLSCKKKKDVKRITAAGYVLNEQNNKPVPGITVSLNQSCGSSGLGSGSDWSVIASTVTDNNGYYVFNTDVSNCSGWKIDINASPGYNSRYSTTWYSVKPNEAVNKNATIYRNTTLTVIANTSDPLGPNDDFFMNLPGIGCRCSYLTTTVAKGGFYNEISWTVKRNNVTNTYKDTVFCTLDLDRTYTIHY